MIKMSRKREWKRYNTTENNLGVIEDKDKVLYYLVESTDEHTVSCDICNETIKEGDYYIIDKDAPDLRAGKMRHIECANKYLQNEALKLFLERGQVDMHDYVYI